KVETSSPHDVTSLKEALDELQRWEGEGGSPGDPFGVVEDLYRRAMAATLARHERATWPGWASGPNMRLTPPPRVLGVSREVEDMTNPYFRGHGFYLIKVPSVQYSQVIRASHVTASRVARSRTQYGPSELHFLGEIETPALD